MFFALPLFLALRITLLQPFQRSLSQCPSINPLSPFHQPISRCPSIIHWHPPFQNALFNALLPCFPLSPSSPKRLLTIMFQQTLCIDLPSALQHSRSFFTPARKCPLLPSRGPRNQPSINPPSLMLSLEHNATLHWRGEDKGRRPIDSPSSPPYLPTSSPF